MNRNDWEAQVFASNMNPTARMVCIVIGSHGNWTEEREVRPSVQRIAGMAGVSRETAGKYVEALEQQGWIKHVRTLKNNVKVYELMPQVVDCVGILAVPKRGNQFTKKSQVVESVDNLDEQDEVRLSNESTLGCRNKQVRLSNQAVQVVDSSSTNLKNLLKEPTREPTTSEPTVSDEPVPSLPNIKREEKMRSRPLNSLEKKELKRLVEVYRVDESDSSLIRKMLESNQGKGDSFTDRVYDLMKEIGIEVGEAW